MKKLILFLLFIAFGASAATSFTEFYVISGGDNLNAGSTTNAAANTTYTSSTGGAGWSATTGVFTPAAGNPSTDTGVSNGAWASIYVTSGATTSTFCAIITNTTSTTFTVSLVAVAGTPPATDASGGLTTAKIGGAWSGPGGPTNFPFGFVTATMTNGGQVTRVNGQGTNNISVGAVHNKTGPIRWQGYTSVPGDGGYWTLHQTNSGAELTILQCNNQYNWFENLDFDALGSTSGGANGLNINNSLCVVRRCKFHDFRGSGLATGAGITIECEAYNCNRSAGVPSGAFNNNQASGVWIRCISHDNTNAGSCGWTGNQLTSYINCIASNNKSNGVYQAGTTIGLYALGCDFYNNGGAGIETWSTGNENIFIENCNFVKNGTYAINSGNLLLRQGYIGNNGFGAGTQANGSGDIVAGLQGVIQNNNFSYAANVTPWTDPANGDFRINLAAARAAGRGTFLQTMAGFSGTIGYPDVGSAQSLTNASSSASTSGYATGQ